VVVVQQELFMLSVSQEIYSRRIRLVFQNRGKLFSVSIGYTEYDYWSILIAMHFVCIWEDVLKLGENMFKGRARVLPR